MHSPEPSVLVPDSILRATRSSAWLLAAILVVGCAGTPKATQQPSSNTGELAALGNRVAELDKRLLRIETLLADALKPEQEIDPKAVYSVPIDGDPFEGAEHAKVTVIKAFEFACSYCYRARPTVTEILSTYGADVKVVYKYYVVHEQAVGPGLAVCAAHHQGKFSQMKDLIWDKGFAEGELGAETMKALAVEAGLDSAKFAKDFAPEGRCMSWLKRSHGILNKLGVKGTPAWFVNGRFVSGAQPFEVFKALIDEELAKANKIVGGGVPVSEYYQREIVAKGLKEQP